MRRQVIHVADDILMEEILSMTKAHGFHIRISCGMVCMDRVPNLVRKDAPKVVRLAIKEKAK